MRRLIYCLLLLASVTANATTYRWVDANGVTHYSDQPQPGATKIELPPAQTYNSGATAKAPAAATDDVPPGAAAGAVAPMLTSGCAISAPQDEQSFINISSLKVAAKGPTGGEVRLLLDGGLLQKGNSSEFLVNPINRGMHRAIVVFMNLGGGELCRTKPVTFYVRKASAIRPAGKH